MPMIPATRTRAPKAIARGLSIVELLIGVAIGLFVLAGASMVASGQMIDNRRLLLETQVQQDMRTAMDLITRDIRRSGYYENSFLAIAPAATTDPASVVSAYAPATVSDSTEVFYNWSHDRDNSEAENNTVDGDEFNGFRWNSAAQTVEVRLGSNNFQALTDPNVLKVTSFTVTEAPQTINLPCATGACVSASGCGVRTLTTNVITIAMSGEAVHDPSVKRSLVGTVRVRNDRVCI